MRKFTAAFNFIRTTVLADSLVRLTIVLLAALLLVGCATPYGTIQRGTSETTVNELPRSGWDWNRCLFDLERDGGRYALRILSKRDKPINPTGNLRLTIDGETVRVRGRSTYRADRGAAFLPGRMSSTTTERVDFQISSRLARRIAEADEVAFVLEGSSPLERQLAARNVSNIRRFLNCR